MFMQDPEAESSHSLFCLQVVPASVQRNSPNVNAYISLCLGVSLSFSAGMHFLLLLPVLLTQVITRPRISSCLV